MSVFRGVALALLAPFMLLVGVGQGAVAQSCREDTTGLVPLTELGGDTYLGLVGGLYPDGSNTLPAEHLALGLELASRIEPLDESGSADPAGTIGLISIGVSNTRDEFDAFIDAAADEPDLNPKLIMVNGAQGARELNTWANASRSNPWRNLVTTLREEGVSASQIQVAWIMLPDRSQGTPSLEDIPGEVEKLTDVMHHLRTNFPNIRLAYVSSRIYGGYSADGEPRAYQHGFTVKSFVEQQISGDPALNPDPAQGPVTAPWVAWGPYTWADGTTPRADDLTWECDDFEADGIHPSVSGAEKVAALLMEHFRTHPTASSWYVGSGVDPSTTTSMAVTSTTPTTITATTSDPTTIPPPTTQAAIETPLPQPVDGGVDVPWVLGGLALGLVLSLGAAWSLGGRRQTDEPPPYDD